MFTIKLSSSYVLIITTPFVRPQKRMESPLRKKIDNQLGKRFLKIKAECKTINAPLPIIDAENGGVFLVYLDDDKNRRYKSG